MANMLDYVSWRGDLSFFEAPFNEIDNLILSELVYLDFATSFIDPNKILTLKEASNIMFEITPKEKMVLGLIVPSQIISLCNMAKETIRFGTIKVSDYINFIDNEISCQFASICFHLPNNILYVAFRGTDDTLIGWQENLDMINTFMVPAQTKAVNYLNEMALKYPKMKIYVGGHSKGGNLATVAAIYCADKVKNRIIKVFNNDGPGFIANTINVEKYQAIEKKILRIIPYSSIVGQLFNCYAFQTMIVSSDAKGIRQHNGFSWLLDGPKFILCNEVSKESLEFKVSVDELLLNMSVEDKKDLANNVYTFILKLVELNKDTLLEVTNDPLKLIKYLNVISFKNKKVFMSLIVNMIKHKQL